MSSSVLNRIDAFLHRKHARLTPGASPAVSVSASPSISPVQSMQFPPRVSHHHQPHTASPSAFTDHLTSSLSASHLHSDASVVATAAAVAAVAPAELRVLDFTRRALREAVDSLDQMSASRSELASALEQSRQVASEAAEARLRAERDTSQLASRVHALQELLKVHAPDHAVPVPVSSMTDSSETHSAHAHTHELISTLSSRRVDLMHLLQGHSRTSHSNELSSDQVDVPSSAPSSPPKELKDLNQKTLASPANVCRSPSEPMRSPLFQTQFGDSDPLATSAPIPFESQLDDLDVAAVTAPTLLPVPSLDAVTELQLQIAEREREIARMQTLVNRMQVDEVHRSEPTPPLKPAELTPPAALKSSEAASSLLSLLATTAPYDLSDDLIARAMHSVNSSPVAAMKSNTPTFDMTTVTTGVPTESSTSETDEQEHEAQLSSLLHSLSQSVIALSESSDLPLLSRVGASGTGGSAISVSAPRFRNRFEEQLVQQRQAALQSQASTVHLPELSSLSAEVDRAAQLNAAASQLTLKSLHGSASTSSLINDKSHDKQLKQKPDGTALLSLYERLRAESSNHSKSVVGTKSEHRPALKPSASAQSLRAPAVKAPAPSSVTKASVKLSSVSRGKSPAPVSKSTTATVKSASPAVSAEPPGLSRSDLVGNTPRARSTSPFTQSSKRDTKLSLDFKLDHQRQSPTSSNQSAPVPNIPVASMDESVANPPTTVAPLQDNERAEAGADRCVSGVDTESSTFAATVSGIQDSIKAAFEVAKAHAPVVVTPATSSGHVAPVAHHRVAHVDLVTMTVVEHQQLLAELTLLRRSADGERRQAAAVRDAAAKTAKQCTKLQVELNTMHRKFEALKSDNRALALMVERYRSEIQFANEQNTRLRGAVHHITEG